jgi:hypothetical protein
MKATRSSVKISKRYSPTELQQFTTTPSLWRQERSLDFWVPTELVNQLPSILWLWTPEEQEDRQRFLIITLTKSMLSSKEGKWECVPNSTPSGEEWQLTNVSTLSHQSRV